MKSKQINDFTALHKKEWNAPKIYLLDIGNINGGANPGLHEHQFHSSFSQFGHHYVVTKTSKGGLSGHQVPGTHLNYSS